jgi:hypothetical protein
VTGKTGGQNSPWITLDRPKPAPVTGPYDYSGQEPPEQSERCRWWLAQIGRGWRPNRHIRRHCTDCAAEWYGVWMWEYVHRIRPALEGKL